MNFLHKNVVSIIKKLIGIKIGNKEEYIIVIEKNKQTKACSVAIGNDWLVIIAFAYFWTIGSYLLFSHDFLTL